MTKISDIKAPTMFIMRGIQGSGKSTLVKELMSKFLGVCVSADHFFFVNGKYVWKQELLSQAHAWAQGRALELCRVRTPYVYIDNTNVVIKHMEPYMDIAKEYGYNVVFAEVHNRKVDAPTIDTYATRNQHGVDRCVIERCNYKWQELPEELAKMALEEWSV